MSQIILARRYIESVLTMCDIDRSARVRLGKALKLMYREPPVQYVTKKPQRITAAMCRQVHAMKGQYTIHEIANLTGIHNSGRVSEILNHKRPRPKPKKPNGSRK
jgi:hypothetical protein